MPDREQIFASLRSDLKDIILRTGGLDEAEEKKYLESFAERICEAAEAEALTIYQNQGSENIFYFIYYHPSLLHSVYSSPAMVSCLKEKLVGYRIPEGVGIVGEVIQTGKSFIFSKDKDRRRMLDLSEYTGFAVSSMVTVPLALQSPIGALQILNKNRYSDRFKFVEEDLEVIEPLSDLLSLLLAKSWQLLDGEAEDSESQAEIKEDLNPSDLR